MAEIKVLADEQLTSKIAVVVGTRPGIVMFSPIIHHLRTGHVPHFVVHTGQHYSPNMDARFFADLDLPEPDFRVDGVAEKPTHGGQTAAMLEGIEAVLLRERPGLVLVGGDANTNLAGALAARKLRIRVGHVEAGERSFDWRMPEEHNRRMIDHISDLLFATNDKARANLEREAVCGEIIVTGNPIVDASQRHLDIARQRSRIHQRIGVPARYALMTAHREENVDFPEHLAGIIEGVRRVTQALSLPVLFPAHPRTRERLQRFGLLGRLQGAGIRHLDPLGYLDFLALLDRAELVLTDSGGVQQEACLLGTPAVTLRESTEWSETLECGANRLAGTDPARILDAARGAVGGPAQWPIAFGDGRAAQRIVRACCAAIGPLTPLAADSG